MSIFKCKMCGGTLEIQNNETVAICEYCGTKQTLPRLDDEKRANLYDRANHFRRNNEFDKAAAIYEQILSEDGKDAEAYWSLVLCRYGIEYVEDPATHKRVPTVNRAQFTSIYADADYQAALEHADGYQRTVYEEEAKAIDEIQKGILAISQKEEPFDVFICYKETDNNGRRTPDSVLANDLYHQLTQEGFKVFFARITLEDKLGSAYEPYIFAALNSAKAMVVLGTKPEYFNAVWVKNEWSRFLALAKDGKKTLIPAYKDMDPYHLPPEFANLQAQDMSKLGFMQDLIRGIKKLVEQPNRSDTGNQAYTVGAREQENDKTAPLMKRAFIFLEDKDWSNADEYCEKVLDMDPENGQAYLCKMMIELRIPSREALGKQERSFEDNINFQRAKRYASPALLEELNEYTRLIKNRKEESRKEAIYQDALAIMARAGNKTALYNAACEKFTSISTYKDAVSLAKKCQDELENIHNEQVYASALACSKTKTIKKQQDAIALFESIKNYKDAEEQIRICSREIDKIKVQLEQAKMHKALVAEEERHASVYRSAAALLNKAKTESECVEARGIFESLGGYENARLMTTQCDAKILDLRYGAVYANAIALGRKNDRTNIEKAISMFETIRTYKDAEKKISEFRDKLNAAQYEGVYVSAIALMKGKTASDLTQAKALFESLNGYKDALNYARTCEMQLDKLGRGESLDPIATPPSKKKPMWIAISIVACILLLCVVTVFVVMPMVTRHTEIPLPSATGTPTAIPDPTASPDIPATVEVEIGDIVKFGSYEQDNNTANGPEEIEWIVLDKQDGRALLLSKYGLDAQPFNTAFSDVTWETCSLREWLNSIFIETAFEDRQQALIVNIVTTSSENEGDAVDRVFLLSCGEISSNLGSGYSRRYCSVTAYAQAQGAWVNTNDNSSLWWTRTTHYSEYSGSATVVYHDGDFTSGRVDYTHYAVRPSIWVDLEAQTSAKLLKTPERSSQIVSKDVAVGDMVKFGLYEQDNDFLNGREEIEWIVLDKQDGKALLLSKYGLDLQKYNTFFIEITWETCTLRSWLNSAFYTTAFNSNQQAVITNTTLTNPDDPSTGTDGGNNTTDKVFLLSVFEAEQYFASDSARKCMPTAYAKAQGAYVNSSTNSSVWWLRSPGRRSNLAASVMFDGQIYCNSCGDYAVVRPAIWINLES